jgi:SAM-dependent methyltransferase
MAIGGASGVDRKLFARFLHVYPFQPATALFRAVEINQVAARPFPTGLGLDLGCGDGLLTGVLFEQTGPRRIVGIDPDPAEVSAARGLGLYQSLHVASGSALPLADGSCDWVFSNSVLEHVDDIPGIFKEVARVLRPGGHFLFTVPGDQFRSCLGGPLLPGANREQYLDDLDARVAHRRYWNQSEWQSNLREVGLEMTSVSRYMTGPELRRWEMLTRLTAGVLYGLFRRSRQPIDIQRSLGLRRSGLRLPKPLASLLARVLAFGLPAGVAIDADAPAACLRIEATKPRQQSG